jgi:hypothetical protein
MLKHFSLIPIFYFESYDTITPVIKILCNVYNKMKLMYQHITIIIVISLIIYYCNSNTYTEKQVIGRLMSFPENVLPRNKYLLASDASGNLELVDLNKLITELETKMNYIRANSKGDKGDPGINGSDGVTGPEGPEGPQGPQGSNANCVLKDHSYHFSSTNADHEACLTTDGENRDIGGHHDGARWAHRGNKGDSCLTVKLH